MPIFIVHQSLSRGRTEDRTHEPWEMSAKGISDIFFFVSNNKVMAFNVKTLSGGVLIDGDTEGYTVTSVDCTEVAAPTETDPKASFVAIDFGS